jgi:hypothetical protein
MVPFSEGKTTDTTAVEIRSIGEKLGTGKNEEKTTDCGRPVCSRLPYLYLAGMKFWRSLNRAFSS